MADVESRSATQGPATVDPGEPRSSESGRVSTERAGHRRRALAWFNQRGFRLAHIADFVGLYAILVLAMLVRQGSTWPEQYSVQAYLAAFLLTVVVFQVSLYFGGLYEREPRLGRPPVMPRAARQSLVAGGVMALLILAATGIVRELSLVSTGSVSLERAVPIPISVLAALIVLCPVWIAVVRQGVKTVRTRREGPPRLLLVGQHVEVALARRHLDVARRDGLVNIVGFVHDIEEAAAAAARRDATDVLLLSSENLEVVQATVLPLLERQGRKVLLRVSASDTLYGLQRLREIGGLPFILVGSQAMPPYRRRLKRLIDLSSVILLSPVLVPVTLATAAYVLMVAGPPVLFWQTRVGAGGRIFRMVKFRTMVPEAEEDGRARLADVRDDRIVRGCEFLRSTRLDELPQLWNIVRGEMGLVGPRPERPALTAEFERDIPGYARRHEVPPGITGLAQIHGRYHTDAEYKLGYDLQYLVNWSPVLDVEILARTVWVVLTRRV